MSSGESFICVNTSPPAARAPGVFYNRANGSGAIEIRQSGDGKGNAIFGPGVRRFHSGGIFAALSDTTPEFIEGMQAARNAGALSRLI
jgi:2-dehydro-3-deoxygluconokinase